MIRFYGEELLATRPTPNWGPPLVGCPPLLIQYIRSYPPYWRPFLHPQPEDAPCRGDRDPLITGHVLWQFVFVRPLQNSWRVITPHAMSYELDPVSDMLQAGCLMLFWRQVEWQHVQWLEVRNCR